MGDHGAGQLSGPLDGPVFSWDGRARAYRVRLDNGFRQILRELMEQFLALLDDPGAPVLHRLFPPAYSARADVALQDEYRQLMQEDLVAGRRAECQVVLDSLEAKTLSEDQLLAWSRAVNGLRLAIGTYLDISDEEPGSEEPVREDSTEMSAYHFLTFLLQESIDVLSGHT